jgi:hypothetical protein
VWRSYCWVVRFKEKRKSKAEGVAASLRFLEEKTMERVEGRLASGG